MAGQIKHSDIIEDGVFQPTVEGALSLIKVLNDLKENFQDILSATKEQAKSNPFANFNDIEKATKALNDAKEATAGLVNAEKSLATVTEAVARDFEKEEKILADVKGELNANILAQVKLKQQIKELSAAQKELQKDQQQGRISVEELTARTAALVREELLLKQASSELGRTISAQNKEQIAASGSMDALAQRVGQLKSAYRALSEQDRGNIDIGGALLASISEADAEIKALDGSIGNFQRNVGNYANAFSGAFSVVESELKQLRTQLADPSLSGQALDELRKREELLIHVTDNLNQEFSSTRQQSRAFQEAAQTIGIALGQQSETFQNFTAQVGEGVDSLADIRDSINLAASDTNKLDKLIGLANGLAGGFAVAEGATALFGVESEELQKTMVKLQAVLAVVNGLQAIQAELKNKDSLATKGLLAIQTAYNVVIGASTGLLKAAKIAFIGLGIGAIVVGIVALVQNWDKLVGALRSFVGMAADATKSMEEMDASIEKNNKAIEGYAELRKMRIALIQDEVAREKAAATDKYNNAVYAAKKEIENADVLAKTLVALQETYRQDIRNIDAKATKKADEDRKKKTEDDKKALQERIKKEFESRTLIVSNMKEGTKKIIAEENLSYEQRKAALAGNYAALEQLEIDHQKKLADIVVKGRPELIKANQKTNKEIKEDTKKTIEEQRLIDIDAVEKGTKEREDRLAIAEEARLIKAKKTADQISAIGEFANKNFEKQAEKRKVILDKETEASKNRQEELRALALQGDKNAQDSIALEDKRQAEIEIKREKELAKAKRRELLLTGINTYNSKVQAGDKNALASTIRDLTLLSSALNAIPGFYEGTESISDTLGRPQLPGKDGYIVRVDGRERIINPGQNAALGDITNADLTKVANMYQKGFLVPANQIPAYTSNSTIDVSQIVSKLDEVTTSIKNIPTNTGYYDAATHALYEVSKRGARVQRTKYKL